MVEKWVISMFKEKVFFGLFIVAVVIVATAIGFFFGLGYYMAVKAIGVLL